MKIGPSYSREIGSRRSEQISGGQLRGLSLIFPGREEFEGPTFFWPLRGKLGNQLVEGLEDGFRLVEVGQFFQPMDRRAHGLGVPPLAIG